MVPDIENGWSLTVPPLKYAANNQKPSEWLTRGVAIAGYTVATLFVAVSTKWTLRVAKHLLVPHIVLY